MSGLYDVEKWDYLMNQLYRHKDNTRWDRLRKGRSVVSMSHPGGMIYVFSAVDYIASEFPDFAAVFACIYSEFSSQLEVHFL